MFEHWWEYVIFVVSFIGFFGCLSSVMWAIFSGCLTFSSVMDDEDIAVVKRHFWMAMKGITWSSAAFFLSVSILGLYPFTAVYCATTVVLIGAFFLLFTGANDDADKFLTVVLAFVSGIWLFTYANKDFGYSRPYVEWKLTEISKNLNEIKMIADMENVIKYQELKTQFDILDEEFDLDDHKLFVSVQNDFRNFEQIGLLHGHNRYAETKNKMRKEYVEFGKNLEANSVKSADDKTKLVVNDKQNETVTLDVSKLVFVYHQNIIRFDLIHKTGNCFETENGKLHLQACYTSTGDIAVTFRDADAYSVSNSYKIEAFLNGPVSLDDVIIQK